MEKKGSFSFGFSSKKEQKKLKESALKEEDKDDVKDTDFITSVEESKVKSTKPVEEAKELVIPLINANHWRHPKRPEELEQGDDASSKEDVVNLNVRATGDKVTDEAVRELLKEAAREQEKLTTDKASQSSIAIPLLLKNKVPDGFENDDRLDVSLRPEESKPADYDQIPIEHFGLAMLRGMGWKEGRGIGKKEHIAKPVDAIVRPKGMGLGADRSLVVQQAEVDRAAATGRQMEELVMKKGAGCLVQTGKLEGLYGKVEGVDEDNVRVVVKLTLSSDVVTLSQRAIRLVSKKEYERYSKYLNKAKVDKYKAEEENKREKQQKHSSRSDNSDVDSDSDRGHSHRRKRKDKKHKHKHHSSDSDVQSKSSKWTNDSYDDQVNGDSKDYSDKYRDRDDKSRHKHKRKDRDLDDSDHKSHRDRDKKKRRDEYDKSSRESSSHRSDKKEHPKSSSGSVRSQPQWLYPNLRVRIVDSDYKKGKYYKSKVVIEDVITMDTCICRTDDGKLLDALSQTQLETVIPKADPAYVMVVSGRHKGQFGEVLGRDKSRSTASVQLIKDRDNVLNFDYDRLCEFTGNLQEDMDY